MVSDSYGFMIAARFHAARIALTDGFVAAALAAAVITATTATTATIATIATIAAITFDDGA